VEVEVEVGIVGRTVEIAAEVPLEIEVRTTAEAMKLRLTPERTLTMKIEPRLPKKVPIDLVAGVAVEVEVEVAVAVKAEAEVAVEAEVVIDRRPQAQKGRLTR